MEISVEDIPNRIHHLLDIIQKRVNNDENLTNCSQLSFDTLLDTLTTLYDECNNDYMKRDPVVANFVDKYRSAVLYLRKMRVNVADFETKTVIGRGHFGEVSVIKEKATGNIYAMKRVKKSNVTGSNGSISIENERNVMIACNHNTDASHWITFLQYAFHNYHYIYFVMEYCPGGNMVALLDSYKGTLPEEMIKFYAAEMTKAINVVHQLGYAHRDIKPDNMVIDKKGHLKLVDFGSSAKINKFGYITDKLVVGTPDYIAPEILQVLNGNGTDTYGPQCDWWSLGIVLYELRVGHTPFSSQQLSSLYSSIPKLDIALQFERSSVSFSTELKSLIAGLLQPATKRLNADRLFCNGFFGVINWARLHERKPPFVPNICSLDDTSYFTSVEPEKLVPNVNDFKLQKEFNGSNLQYVGFTYSRIDPAKTYCRPAVISDVLKKIPSDDKNNDVAEKCRKLALEKNSYQIACAKLQKENEKLIEKNKENIQKMEMAEERTALSLKRVLSKAKDEIEKLKLDLQTKEQSQAVQNLHLKERIAALEMENENLKAKQLISQASLTNSFLEDTKEKTNHLEYLESLKIKEKNNELKTQLDETRNELLEALNSHQEEIRKFNNERETLDLELEKKNKQLKEQVSDGVKKANKIKELMKNNEHLTAEVRSLKSDFNVLQKTIRDEKTNLCETINQLEEKVSNLESKKVELENELMESDDCRKKLQTSVSKLKLKKNDWKLKYETTNKSLSTQKEVVRELEMHIVRLSDELKVLKSSPRELETNNKRKNSVKHLPQIERATNEIAELELGASELESEFSVRIKEMQEKCSKMSDEIELLKNEKIQIEGEKESLKEEIRIYENKMKELEKEIQNQSNDAAKINLEPVGHAESLLLIQRLETQLEKARENAILHRESAAKANRELALLEKELSDAKIDLRIAQREHNESELLIKNLQAEKLQLEETAKGDYLQLEIELKDHKEEIAKLTLEREAHDSVVKAHKKKLADRTCELRKKEVAIKEMTSKYDTLFSEHLDLKVERTDLHNELGKLRKEKDNLEAKLKAAKEEVTKAQQLEKIARGETEKFSEENKKLELQITDLKETCLILDDQLDKFKEYIKTLEKKCEDSEGRLSDLRNMVDKSEGEAKQARKMANEEKSLRLLSETQQKKFATDFENKCKEASQLANLINESENCVTELKAEINEKDNLISTITRDLRDCKERIKDCISEITSLKRERSELLTKQFALNEENGNLREELEEATNDLNSLHSVIRQLQSTVTELEAYHEVRHLKSNATLQQHSKLIDFLQNKIDSTKSKRTLAAKLFGLTGKENFDPKELEHLLQIERSKSKGLADQLYQTQAELMALRGENIPALTTHKDKKLATPLKDKQLISPLRDRLNTDDVKEIVKSPNFTNDNLIAKRIKHFIPHKFKIIMCTRSTLKCAECEMSMAFGTRISQCMECKIYVHSSCAGKLPATCNLPPSLALHFIDLKKKNESYANNQQISDETKEDHINHEYECWVKILGADKRWKRMYAKIENAELLIYSDAPSEHSDRIKISLDGALSITDTVNKCDISLSNTADTDLPFIIKLESRVVSPPKKTYILTSSREDKNKLANAITFVISKCEATNLSNKSVFSNKGVCLFEFRNDANIIVNAATQISPEICIIGTNQGLFSLKIPPPGDGNFIDQKPVLVGGPTCVQSILILKKVKLAALIVEGGVPVTCDLRQLISNSGLSASLSPCIETKPLDQSDRVQLKGCRLLAASKCNTLIAVANDAHVRIIGWDDLSFSIFKHQIDVKNVVIIVFTPGTLLYANNSSFFCMNLWDMSATTILKDSTKGKTVRAPIAILRINETEYLACDDLFGRFVDFAGNRIMDAERIKNKTDTIKWQQYALNVAYRKSFLFIIHHTSISLIHVSPEEGFDQFKSCVVDFANARYAGFSKKGIFLTEASDDCARLFLLDPIPYLQNDAKLSWSSVYTLTDDTSATTQTDDFNDDQNDVTDVSVSSSIFNSSSERDTPGSGNQQRGLERAKKVKFAPPYRK